MCVPSLFNTFPTPLISTHNGPVLPLNTHDRGRKSCKPIAMRFDHTCMPWPRQQLFPPLNGHEVKVRGAIALIIGVMAWRDLSFTAAKNLGIFEASKGVEIRNPCAAIMHSNESL